MFDGLFDSIRTLRWYALFLLLPLGVLMWANATGTRLLGDDNESTETLSNARGSHSSGGHARFYHK